MKGYFKKDYKFQDDENIYSFLKKKYDEADDIFEKRFECDNKLEEKSKQLENLITEVDIKVNQEKEVKSKMVSLVRGITYLRLAQCQSEIFEKSREYYMRAIECLEEHIDYSSVDEIDLLLMLNKGKYFRNTADVGKKSDYERARSIFNDVANSLKNVKEISNEKKFHLLLDAKINIGRVSRYSYDFKTAQEIFLSLILALEQYIDDGIKTELYACEDLKELLEVAKLDNEVKEYGLNVGEEDISVYVWEYLLQSLIHIGIIYRKNSEYEKAYAIFELINKIDSDNEKENIDACNNLGVCHRKLGELKGLLNEEGEIEYDKAEKIFRSLKEKGNKFALINWYKCVLACNHTGKKYEEIIEELKEKEGLNNSVGLLFLLGRFYVKTNNYNEAAKYFKKIYKQKKYIARGCIGFKAYYNLAQCKIHFNEISQACNILNEIRDSLKKNHNHTDILCEIDYGWCLMQEGKYNKALAIYKELLKFPENQIRDKQVLEINNNIADCYIHLGEWSLAEEHLDKVLEIENKNTKARYLKGVILLSKKDISAYNLFNELIVEGINETGINSGWLICAISLYFQSKSEEIKENIIKKIRYSVNKFSMKSFVRLAEFVLYQLGGMGKQNTLFSDFCHIRLVECGENMAFQFLMDSMDFHYFEKEDRAYILANIVKMYEYILEIKNACRVTYDKNGDMAELPYHYTKLSTLNNLLISHGGKSPRLRLWNSVYMNDAYEGKVFDKLLGETNSLNNNIIEKYISNSENSQMHTYSNVYITSFSTAKNSFQMWSIYGDNERGIAIKFAEDFFDIKDNYHDFILDNSNDDEYALYKVQYLDANEVQNESDIMDKLKKIANYISLVEERLEDLCPEKEMEEYRLFKNAEEEVRTFITDRLNEVRFLFKTKSYEYESELRLIRCSRESQIDDKNFEIPRLYINVDKVIDNLEIKVGSKLEKQEMKDLVVWLKNTGKIKNIKGSSLAENSMKI